MKQAGSSRVAGVVLAAGSSRRMGRNKLLLRLGGQSLLRRSVTQALEAGLDPVLVVLGHEADRGMAEIEGLACRPVVNENHERGMNSSVRAGIAEVPSDAEAAVILLADMPLVTGPMIAALVARYRESRPALVISDYEGVAAPPTLYDRRLFAELGASDGEGCGRRVIERHRAEAAVVGWPASALSDVDRPGDLERIETDRSGGKAACGPSS